MLCREEKCALFIVSGFETGVLHYSPAGLEFVELSFSPAGVVAMLLCLASPFS